MFRLRHVKYKDILNIPNLDIEAGKVTSIVGESGSGKTTLLKLLNQLISCDEGEVFYNDVNVQTIDSIQLRRQVVMLGQTPVMFEGTVRENLAIGCRLLRLS
ncbi:ATP-binding cassette domain-containing protein [Camelliibacillus cellulosilyticus]|uniref:ATP-binding cassette domain-containing protein n=1 Tax=Camelliibacillus cellulosilyticus TaxID=2174486 RepID=A0ABV9GKK2_9BACL